MTDQLWWYVARASGMVGWGLLSASVLWGLALSTQALGPRPRPRWLLDLHRFIGGLAVIFTVVHVSAIVADGYVHFGLVEVLVPFTGSWHPVAVAWGITATYLLLAVELTSLARKRLPRKLWRLVHMASFPLFALATVHGLTAGTDGGSPVFVAMVAAVTVAVTVLTYIRVRGGTRDEGRRHHPTGARPTPVRPTASPARPDPVPVGAGSGGHDVRSGHGPRDGAVLRRRRHRPDHARPPRTAQRHQRGPAP